MADDILGDLLRAHDGPGEAPRAGGFGDIVGRAVSDGRSAAPVRPATPVDLAPLMALDRAALTRLMRYLPADALVPLLARAPVQLSERIVGLMDAESQSWLAAQSDELEATTPEAHAAAARKALALVERALAGPASAAPPAVLPARPARPVQVGVQFDAAPVTAAPPASAPAAPAVPAPAPVTQPDPTPAPAVQTGDGLVDTLATLISLSAGRNAAQLREIAASVDHPVLVAGLEQIAGGGDAHAINEAVRGAGHDWIIAQNRQVELIRLAVLAIRFGDGPQRFREQANEV